MAAANPDQQFGVFHVDIPDSVLAEVSTHIEAINGLMKPYFVPISEEQKDHLIPMADEGIPFGDKVNTYMDSEPKYNAQYVDVPETHKDYSNFKKGHC